MASTDTSMPSTATRKWAFTTMGKSSENGSNTTTKASNGLLAKREFTKVKPASKKRISRTLLTTKTQILEQPTRWKNTALVPI